VDGQRKSRRRHRGWSLLPWWSAPHPGLLAQDQSTAQIAGQLVISASAVRVHVAAIARMLEVSGRPAAVDLLRQRPTA